MEAPRMVRFPVFVSLFLLSLSAAALADSGPLKVLTLNFNSEIAPVDSSNAIRDRRFDGLVQWIGQNHPDIVFLEEAWSYRGAPTVALSLARATGYDVAYRLEMGFPDFFYEADAVLTRPSLQMRDERDLKLPHSAFEIGNGKTWVIPFGAVSYAVGVSLTLADGEPVYAYATHLTGSSARDRADQARAIQRDAQRRAAREGVDWSQAHVIVGGDFNSSPTDPASRLMKSAGFVDSFGAAHPGDPSCSDCSDTSFPWFNPFTTGAGQFPSQTGEHTSLRGDYVWVHSPTLATLASTLMFTAPYNDIWMSDHYGVFTTLGAPGSAEPPNPVHDAPDSADTELVSLTDDFFNCGWIPDSDGCVRQLSPVTASGPRGLTIRNRTDFYLEIRVKGPGDVFTAPSAGLNPGEQATFTFDVPGTYRYIVRDNVESPDPYRATLKGTVDASNL